jgi:UDP-N-acetylglucosamine 2-epimerase (non-hydrolysing)
VEPGVTAPRMSVIHNGSSGASATGDWHSAAIAQADGAVIAHLASRHEDLPRIAAVSWALARPNAFEQIVLDVAPQPGAERMLAGLGAGAAVVRPEAPSGLLEAVRDELAGRRCIALIVYADDDDALAGALAAARLGVSVVRIGGAPRDDGASRAVVRLADLQLVFGDEDALALRGRVPRERIHVVGNPAIDVVRRFGQQATARAAWRELGAEPGTYALAVLEGALPVAGLDELAARETLVIEGAPAGTVVAGTRVAGPLAYVDHLSLVRFAGAVVTTSARVRDEAAALGVSSYASGAEVPPLASTARPAPNVIPLWDGRAGARIARVVIANFARVRLA